MMEKWMVLKINEIIDVSANQQLLDSFCASVGIAAAIIDLDGNVIIGSRWQKICTDFHRVHKRSCEKCVESDTTLANLLKEGEQYSLYRCQHGLFDAASPIVVHGQHIANAFVGQFLTHPPIINDFKQQARAYGFDEPSYLQALSAVPVIEEKKVPVIVNFLVSYAEMLAGMVLKHKKQIASERQLIKAEQEIAERKKFEAVIKEKNEELARSNKELEQFAYVASHDLQEPLRMVASYTELLEERYKGKLDEKADKYIGYAVDGAKRMQGLINDLLVLSRVNSRGKAFAPTDCGKLVEKVMHEIGGAIEEKQAHIQVGALPVIMGDEGQLFQLFQNLISNAIKFHGAEKPVVKVSAHQKKSEWIFSIEDNGIGIDPQFFERIFVIFQRLHERGAYQGTGIGLAISKKIVERHGGNLWVESEPGNGSTFHFSFRDINAHEEEAV
jgi:signal transduction histidine kinase